MDNFNFRLMSWLIPCLLLSLILIACVGVEQPKANRTVVVVTPTIQSTPTLIPDTQQGLPASLQQIDTQDGASIVDTDLTKNMSALQADTRALATFTLTDVLGNYASGWNAMQKDYSKALHDSESGCGNNNVNSFQVSDEINKINDDQYKIASADNQLKIKRDQYKSLFAAVKRDTKLVEDDWKRVKTSPSHINGSDVNKAIAKGKSAMNDTQAVWNSAVETADQYDDKAHTLKLKVDRIVPDMQCS